jgi:hypothetical protein
MADGSVYIGNWADDIPNGQGRIVHPNGDTYEGAWKDGKAHGFGVFTKVGTLVYTGYFEFDKQCG